jgi:hypothetical protein
MILEKLATARIFIKSHPIKKDATNTYSNYDYFSPELVGKMVNDACIEANLICIFNLKKDNLGYYGELTTTELESNEELITTMRTEKPVITATNETQQMGGMNTYTKRYCLMNLFDIEDNTIDFDSQDNSKKSVPTKIENELPWLNPNTSQFDGAIKKLKAGTTTITKIRTVMKVSKKVEELLLASVKGNPVKILPNEGSHDLVIPI